MTSCPGLRLIEIAVLLSIDLICSDQAIEQFSAVFTAFQLWGCNTALTGASIPAMDRSSAQHIPLNLATVATEAQSVVRAYFSGWHFWFYFFRTVKRAA